MTIKPYVLLWRECSICEIFLNRSLTVSIIERFPSMILSKSGIREFFILDLDFVMKFRIGTYSGKGGEYVDISSRKLKTIPREQVKRLFIAKEIDLLINYDLPWNPMKVEQRIGRIDRIGQENGIIYVLNLCYSGSVEEIVYGRLLKRLYEAERVVGSRQISMLPVYPEDFEILAEMRITPEELEKEARKRLIEFSEVCEWNQRTFQ